MTFLHPVPLSTLHTINLLLMYCPQNKKIIQLKIILYPCLQYPKSTRLNICQFWCTVAQFRPVKSAQKVHKFTTNSQYGPKFRIIYAKNSHICCPQGRGMLRCYASSHAMYSYCMVAKHCIECKMLKKYWKY